MNQNTSPLSFFSRYIHFLRIFLCKDAGKDDRIPAQNDQLVTSFQTRSLGICCGLARQTIVSFVGIYMIGLPLAVDLTMSAILVSMVRFSKLYGIIFPYCILLVMTSYIRSSNTDYSPVWEKYANYKPFLYHILTFCLHCIIVLQCL